MNYTESPHFILKMDNGFAFTYKSIFAFAIQGFNFTSNPSDFIDKNAAVKIGEEYFSGVLVGFEHNLQAAEEKVRQLSSEMIPLPSLNTNLEFKLTEDKNFLTMNRTVNSHDQLLKKYETRISAIEMKLNSLQKCIQTSVDSSVRVSFYFKIYGETFPDFSFCFFCSFLTCYRSYPNFAAPYPLHFSTWL